MKVMKHILVLGGLMIGMAVNAQKASIETASIALRSYDKKGEKKEVRIHNLNEAKNHIDMAFENSSTSNDPKMWQIRARVYLALQIDTLGEKGKSCIPTEDAIATAADAIINCHKSDEKQKYSRASEAYTAFVNIAMNARYIADLSYNQKNYDQSVKYYKVTSSLIPYDDQSLLKRQNITEDGLLYNVATTEKLAKDYEAAKKDFIELIKRNYNDPWVYLELYQIYLEVDNDTNLAIETIDKGRMMFEDNVNLRRQQIYIYSVSGRSADLIKILDESIENDPYNGNNYYLRGIMYDEMGDVEKAEADYLKAIEYNDELLTAYEDLGKLYYNKGASIAAEANSLGLNETAKYEKMNAQVIDYFNKAIPNFEKIFELTADEKQKNQAAQVLMSMYLKTEQMDKYKELKAQFQ